MLVLRRKRGESILIGPDIVVHVTEVSTRGTVALGITAPAHVQVIRKELLDGQNKQAGPLSGRRLDRKPGADSARKKEDRSPG